jgi:hypothetical protein
LRNPALALKKKESIKSIAQSANQKPISIPVIIYKERSDILGYLGYRHITGVKEWNSLEKARYLKLLYEQSKVKDYAKKCKELALIIGSRSDYVKKLLCALSVYDKIEESDYFDIKGLEEESLSFSLITTALGYKNLRAYLNLESDDKIEIENLNVKNLTQLTRWIFDKSRGTSVVVESRQLSQLAEIVAVKESREFLEKENDLEAAFLLSGGVVQMISNAIEDAHRKLKLALTYTRSDTILDEVEYERLKDIKKLSDSISKMTKKDEKSKK